MPDYAPKASYHLTYSGEYSDVDKGIREFMRALLEMEDDLLELETKVSKQPIGLTGLKATSVLGELEMKQNELASEIQQAHEAVRDQNLAHLERNPEEDHHHRTRDYVNQYRGDFHEVLHRLENISARTSRRIDSKRNAANTRLVLTVSIIAVLISISSLLLTAV